MNASFSLRFILFFAFFSFVFSPDITSQTNVSSTSAKPSSVKAGKPTGTGRTTGHIADLFVENKGKSPVVIQPQTFYIPSEGQYQPYVGTIPSTVIPPGGTITIPVNGYCADVHTPPVGAGDQMPPLEDWVPVGDPQAPVPPGTIQIIPGPIQPPFMPGDIHDIISGPGFTAKPPTPGIPGIPTWPGTDFLVGGVIDPIHHPDVFAPLIVTVLDEIQQAVSDVLEDGEHTTPFSGNPEKEREAVIQQTFWIYMAGITGLPYEKDQFEEKVIDQFEAASGKTVTSIPTEDKEKLDSGVDAFWSTFMAVGTEAKVLSNPEAQPISDTTNPSPSEKVKDQCDFEETVTDTGPKLDHAIANTGTKEKNEEVKEAFKNAIEEAAGLVSQAKGSDTVDIEFTTPEMPASAWSLYFPHTVAGRANASAMAIDMKNPTQSAFSTEPIQTKADGEHKVVLVHKLGPECTSTMVGINFAKVRAASGLNASLGNIEALQVVNFVGELAIDILIKRGKGTFTKMSKYLKEKAKDMAKDEAKDFIKDELKKLEDALEGKSEEEAEQLMDELMEDIKSGEKGEAKEDNGDFLNDWIAEQIIEGDDFNPAEKIEGDLLDKIDSPIDWAPIKTNTYALAEGALDIWVDEVHDRAKAGSGVRYKRVEFESKEEAEKGGGIFCEEGMASDVTAGTITLITKGSTATYAGATGEGIFSTGHGIATATLESFNGLYVIAICQCPDTTRYDTYSSVTGYSTETNMTGIWASVFDNLMNDVAEKLDQEIAEKANRGGLPKDFARQLQKDMELAAARASESILPCEKKK